MKIFNIIDLSINPEQIIPDDSISTLALTAIPDDQWVINPDVLDVALSYTMSGKEVIMQIKYSDVENFDLKSLFSTSESASFSLSLLPPTDSSDYQAYSETIIEWYNFWASTPSFSQIIYPLVPYIEYLIAFNLNSNQSNELMENPSDEYSAHFKSIMPAELTDLFKKDLSSFIDKNDPEIYDSARDAILKAEMEKADKGDVDGQFVSTGSMPPFSLLHI